VYVFFSISLLFTNENFRCYLQQQRPTPRPSTGQLQHFRHHNDASTRDYHQHQHQGRRTWGLEAQTPLGRVSFFISFTVLKNVYILAMCTERRTATTTNTTHRHRHRHQAAMSHRLQLEKATLPSHRRLQHGAGSGEGSGRSRGQRYFSFSFSSLYYMFIHN
jgi:hypothetical protein